MKPAARRPLAALVLLYACSNAHAADTVGFYQTHRDRLQGMPTHVVLLDDELRTQLPYGNSGIDPGWRQSLVQTTIDNTLATVPGISMGQAMAAGAVGGLLGAAIAAKAAEVEAEARVEPAHNLLREAGCPLPVGDQLAQAVGAGLLAGIGGPASQPKVVTLGPKQDVDDVVDRKSERRVLTGSSSITPDFSTVVTSLKIDVYSAAIEGADRRWETRPVRTDRLVVASDQVRIEPKTQDDIDALVKAENERFAAGPTQDLIAKANAGDRAARKKALKEQWRHDFRLKEARQTNWTPATAALKHAGIWVADDCSLLTGALRSNNAELERMLVALHDGSLPGQELAGDEGKIDIMQPLPGEQDGVRMVNPLPGNTFLSRRGGDYASLAYLYTWYEP